VSVVCCQVEVSATSWSLVQRSPTDCGASLCVIWKREWGGHGPLAVVPETNKQTMYPLSSWIFMIPDHKPPTLQAACWFCSSAIFAMPVVFWTHVELAGGPAHKLGFISFIHVYLLDCQQLPLYWIFVLHQSWELMTSLETASFQRRNLLHVIRYNSILI